ncbi:MAG TPA: FecR domain-containing protein [Candidatus Ozemobacteraceae bacterium]|nr:FecR domain-containing protein [Candidatus Ozemobacteraceae bacterium]HQG27636.1 FecR domain-containing protein [Candidatus Ozemobacteraceae bacterium]
MDCKQFRSILEAADTLGVPAELKQHAATCASCARLLEAQERMSIGLEINRRAVHAPDLTARIMRRVAQEKPAASDSPGWLERLVALVTPKTAFASSVFYVAAGVVIVALSHAVIDRGSELQDLRRHHAWRMVSAEGRISGASPDAKTKGVAFGTRLACEDGATARVELGDRFRLSLNGANAVLASGQVDLESGSIDADIVHVPNAVPFLIKTPHADVTDIGTTFTVTVLNGSTTVSLRTGAVRVTSSATHESRELKPSENLTVGSDGFVHPKFPVSKDPATAPVDPDFRRIQPPDE